MDDASGLCDNKFNQRKQCNTATGSSYRTCSNFSKRPSRLKNLMYSIVSQLFVGIRIAPPSQYNGARNVSGP